MIKNIPFVFVLIILCFNNFYAQNNEELITVVGSKMIGKNVNGEMVREVFGNVVLTQGNVKVTCDHAIQFISNNNAELIENVVVTQDSLTITTDRGFYYGNERKAESNSGVILDDKKVILAADSGEYFFRLSKAYFRHNVKLFDTVTTLTSKALTYFKNENRMIAIGDVKIVDKENIITSDSLEYFRNTRITYAYKNVNIKNFRNNVVIYGDHLEDYAKNGYTLVNLNPLLIQVDTTSIIPIDSVLQSSSDSLKTYKLDTLIIKSQTMEAFRKTDRTENDSSFQDIFKATDSVKIVRERFASLNDLTTYYRDDQKIITKKISNDAKQPILWYGNSQLTGDSITIYLRENRIKLLDVDNSSFLLSQDSIYINRFNQLSGERIEVEFSGGEISKTKVFGDVHSIYYMYEDTTRNGLTKSSSQSATINFDNKKVSEVKLYGTPSSEYYPENKVVGKELSFTLPDYVFHNNRPSKKILLSQLKNE
jgi:lipopolysaccharide export system protein LptA